MAVSMASANERPPDCVIASSNRFNDIGAYCSIIYCSDPDKWGAVFPWDFPQNASREDEEKFLRTYFTEREIYMQGGAHGPGNGFKFLKQVWYCNALWNLNWRVPAVAQWWREQDDNEANLLEDPEMKAFVLADDVEVSTFFQRSEVEIYGEKFLQQVIKFIQAGVRGSAVTEGEDEKPESSANAHATHAGNMTNLNLPFDNSSPPCNDSVCDSGDAKKSSTSTNDSADEPDDSSHLAPVTVSTDSTAQVHSVGQEESVDATGRETPGTQGWRGADQIGKAGDGISVNGSSKSQQAYANLDRNNSYQPSSAANFSSQAFSPSGISLHSIHPTQAQQQAMSGPPAYSNMMNALPGQPFQGPPHPGDHSAGMLPQFGSQRHGQPPPGFATPSRGYQYVNVYDDSRNKLNPRRDKRNLSGDSRNFSNDSYHFSNDSRNFSNLSNEGQQGHYNQPQPMEYSDAKFDGRHDGQVTRGGRSRGLSNGGRGGRGNRHNRGGRNSISGSGDSVSQNGQSFSSGRYNNAQSPSGLMRGGGRTYRHGSNPGESWGGPALYGSETNPSFRDFSGSGYYQPTPVYDMQNVSSHKAPFVHRENNTPAGNSYHTLPPPDQNRQVFMHPQHSHDGYAVYPPEKLRRDYFDLECSVVNKLVFIDIPAATTAHALKSFLNQHFGNVTSSRELISSTRNSAHRLVWVEFSNCFTAHAVLMAGRNGLEINNHKLRVEVPKEFWDPSHHNYIGRRNLSPPYPHGLPNNPMSGAGPPPRRLPSMRSYDSEAQAILKDSASLVPLSSCTPKAATSNHAPHASTANRIAGNAEDNTDAITTAAPSVNGTPKKSKKNNSRVKKQKDAATGAARVSLTERNESMDISRMKDAPKTMGQTTEAEIPARPDSCVPTEEDTDLLTLVPANDVIVSDKNITNPSSGITEADSHVRITAEHAQESGDDTTECIEFKKTDSSEPLILEIQTADNRSESPKLCSASMNTQVDPKEKVGGNKPAVEGYTTSLSASQDGQKRDVTSQMSHDDVQIEDKINVVAIRATDEDVHDSAQSKSSRSIQNREEEHIEDSFHTADGSPKVELQVNLFDNRGDEQAHSPELSQEENSKTSDINEASTPPTDQPNARCTEQTKNRQILASPEPEATIDNASPSLSKITEIEIETGLRNGQSPTTTTVTGTGTPLFVTAPSTPALPPNPVRETTSSKKTDKVKGPAQTESLSGFGKKAKPPQNKQHKSSKGSGGTLKGKSKADGKAILDGISRITSFSTTPGSRDAEQASALRLADDQVIGKQISKNSSALTTVASASEQPDHIVNIDKAVDADGFREGVDTCHATQSFESAEPSTELQNVPLSPALMVSKDSDQEDPRSTVNSSFDEDLRVPSAVGGTLDGLEALRESSRPMEEDASGNHACDNQKSEIIGEQTKIGLGISTQITNSREENVANPQKKKSKNKRKSKGKDLDKETQDTHDQGKHVTNGQDKQEADFDTQLNSPVEGERVRPFELGTTASQTVDDGRTSSTAMTSKTLTVGNSQSMATQSPTSSSGLPSSKVATLVANNSKPPHILEAPKAHFLRKKQGKRNPSSSKTADKSTGALAVEGETFFIINRHKGNEDEEKPSKPGKLGDDSKGQEGQVEAATPYGRLAEFVAQRAIQRIPSRALRIGDSKDDELTDLSSSSSDSDE